MTSSNPQQTLPECETDTNDSITEHAVDKSVQTQVIRAGQEPFLQDIIENSQNQHRKNAAIPVQYPYSVIGTLTCCASHCQASVSFCIEEQQYQYEAITTIALKPAMEGEECLLSFHQGNLAQPIITGIIQSEASDPALTPLELHSDVGIHLQCGASSIQLDDNGTINIQGMHINSQAYGPHRIKGGSVKIN